MTRIRRAREDEWDRFRDLRLRALEEAPDAFGSTLERERAYGEAGWRGWLTGWDDATTNVLFVAEVGERWVAVAVGSFAADVGAHLYAMWVEPESRGAGTGRALVDAVVAWAEDETPATALDLWVTQGNDAASALYRSAGFEPTGEREVLREGSTLEIVAMRRRLVRA